MALGASPMLPPAVGPPNNRGRAVTASGLVLIAAMSAMLRAIDVRTGRTLSTDALLTAGEQAEICEGRQYVIDMAGGHH
jgi:hypothetical protein